MEREKAKVKRYLWGEEWEPVYLPILTKEELETQNTRYLVKNKMRGIKHHRREDYIEFIPHPYKGLEGGWYAVKVGDYLDVLASRPHIPNKKEAKGLRKAKKKRGR